MCRAEMWWMGRGKVFLEVSNGRRGNNPISPD
jgi:hypothetical protein